MLVTTCNSLEDLVKVPKVICLSLLKVTLLAVPSSWSRGKILSSLNYDLLKKLCSICLSKLEHLKVGGASESVWTFVTLTSLDLNWAPSSLCPSTLPPVCIFNMIDDKIGGGFKPIPNRAWKTLRRVKDIAWDLGARSTSKYFGLLSSGLSILYGRK